ncbi:hypothetical protein [Reticulibacter mediterranei]|uniref:hypothetical protein n=1 Tax=Reticulibacter mediterranei TaxID=2778369 RepID=UPI001C6916DF|nr:hypothetical protein [Reticulibacter mediterranei]
MRSVRTNHHQDHYRGQKGMDSTWDVLYTNHPTPVFSTGTPPIVVVPWLKMDFDR